MEALKSTVYGDGTCDGLTTNEDRLDCADDVYDAYYSSVGTIPTLENLLAAIFDEELSQVVAFSEGRELAVEAFANNYLALCREGCTKAELLWWLASKQGWYQYAGRPLTNLMNTTNGSVYSPTAASRVFSETWIGGYGDGNVPYDWGNWAYGTSSYINIRGDNQSVEFYHIWQGWNDLHSYGVPKVADGLARCDNGSADATPVPPDFWTDYIVAIVTYNQDQALPSTNLYLRCSSPRPDWLPNPEANPVPSSYLPGNYDHPVWP